MTVYIEIFSDKFPTDVIVGNKNPLNQCKALQGVEINYDLIDPLSEDEWPKECL